MSHDDPTPRKTMLKRGYDPRLLEALPSCLSELPEVALLSIEEVPKADGIHVKTEQDQAKSRNCMLA